VRRTGLSASAELLVCCNCDGVNDMCTCRIQYVFAPMYSIIAQVYQAMSPAHCTSFLLYNTCMSCYAPAAIGRRHNALVVPATRRSTPGDRAFSVAAARAWDALPLDARAPPSLAMFRRRLKLPLFHASFPDD